MKRLAYFAVVLALAFAQMAPGAEWYVATNGTGDGSSWANAMGSIQDAINAATVGDTVLVSNGLYNTGGVVNWPDGTTLTNRVAINKAITVRSANNNPADTIIRGTGQNGPAAVRCVYMIDGAALIGFTLTNGATFASGANNEKRGSGAWCQSTKAMISNCLITGNSGYAGGGAYQGTLYNCTLTGNSAANQGGGAYQATLYDCTLTGNSARSGGGGGTYKGTLYNCKLTGNAADTGGGAVRATLNNCTLTGNAAKIYGGGVYESTLTNCTLTGNSAATDGGGSYYSVLHNCTLTGNSAKDGGGTYLGIQSNCTLTGNSATNQGGGAFQGALYNSRIVSNSALMGGGTYQGTLHNCMLTGNSAKDGGGAFQGTLYNCTVAGNSATAGGGGVYGANICTLYNCMVSSNYAASVGGVVRAILYNCTVTGNKAKFSVGGVSQCAIVNCIVYFNNAPLKPNYDDVTPAFTNSCTTPGPGGIGNVTNDPMLADTNTANYRLSSNSPCVNTGTNLAWMTGPDDAMNKDLDGRARVDKIGGRVDMGCYEYLPGGTNF